MVHVRSCCKGESHPHWDDFIRMLHARSRCMPFLRVVLPCPPQHDLAHIGHAKSCQKGWNGMFLKCHPPSDAGQTRLVLSQYWMEAKPLKKRTLRFNTRCVSSLLTIPLVHSFWCLSSSWMLTGVPVSRAHRSFPDLLYSIACFLWLLLIFFW